jgi:hypothetical protein
MPLRRDDVCICCRNAINAGTTAWWVQAQRAVYCVECRSTEEDRTDPSPAVVTASSGTTLPPPPQIDAGTPGISATKEYGRRVAKAERQIEEKWGTGRMGRFVKRIAEEPQSTTAWAKGADGEQRLGAQLSRELAEFGFVLHDRRVPGTRGNIDHLVVAPSGVWIVDAKNYRGKVERRDVGGWLRSDVRLYVGNRDHTKLVGGLGWQVDAVRTVVEPIGFGHLPIRSVLCFTDAEWGLFSKPFAIDGVMITWAKALVTAIREPGPVEPAVVDLLARHLSAKLPASS